jgi:nucleoside-diphosphate-sugar epimerase
MPPRRTIAVTGATGTIGTALVRRLAVDPRVQEVRAIARRPPEFERRSTVRWIAADIAVDDLTMALRGAHAVVHLAWQARPSRDLDAMEAVNVRGSTRVFEAAARVGVAIVHASSIGAYAPGPKAPPVDESWPIAGHPHHPSSLQKAAVERVLDGIEQRDPDLRVVRIRPGLAVQASATRGMGRSFPRWPLPGRSLPPAVACRAPVRVQIVHADDVADAFALAALRAVHGPFNVATTDPVGSSSVRLIELLARPFASAARGLHLQPVDPRWIRSLARSPLADPARAAQTLDWLPSRTGLQALTEVFDALARPPTAATPALAGPSDL